MTPAEVVLTCILGSLGYLLVGWTTVVICAARWPHQKRAGDIYAGQTVTYAPYGWWLMLVGWPLAFPASVLWVLMRIGLGLARVSLKPVQKLNPEIARWDDQF